MALPKVWLDDIGRSIYLMCGREIIGRKDWPTETAKKKLKKIVRICENERKSKEEKRI